MILPTSPGYDADRKGYDLRQKQLKSPVAGATDKPNLKTGRRNTPLTWPPT